MLYSRSSRRRVVSHHVPQRHRHVKLFWRALRQLAAELEEASSTLFTTELRQPCRIVLLVPEHALVEVLRVPGSRSACASQVLQCDRRQCSPLLLCMSLRGLTLSSVSQACATSSSPCITSLTQDTCGTDFDCPSKHASCAAL